MIVLGIMRTPRDFFESTENGTGDNIYVAGFGQILGF